MKILAYATAKISGLAHIDHRAEAVLHQIHARLVGELADLVANVIVDRHGENQNSAEPGVRAKGMTSRILDTPVMNISIRSKPNPKPL